MSCSLLFMLFPSFSFPTLTCTPNFHTLNKRTSPSSSSMSANDVLDVLNVQRDDLPQPKKKAKTDMAQLAKDRLPREVYNLMGPNTPPILVNMGTNRMKDRKLRVSPWTKMPFTPNQKGGRAPALHHWEKGAKELLTETSKDKPYYFDKFVVSVDIPDMVDEGLFAKFMVEIVDEQKQRAQKVKAQMAIASAKKLQLLSLSRLASAPSSAGNSADTKKEDTNTKNDSVASETPQSSGAESTAEKSESSSQLRLPSRSNVKSEADGEVSAAKETNKMDEDVEPEPELQPQADSELGSADDGPLPWSYEETSLLFQYCKDFELKWFVINDRFPLKYGRTLEDLKEQFYAMCVKIMTHKSIGNPTLIDSLKVFSKSAEVERKHYLLNLLKRTPTEIAEESLLVIEARRFEIAAKKMLMERANLLTLLDLPQAALSVQQYMSSQGLGNLYNLLMILDKNQRKKSQQRVSLASSDPVPPPIPMAASSSHKRDFQTHLQQYLSGFLKQQPIKMEDSPIQQLLAKKLTIKEEEAYGLYYHANERLNPGVILRSTQRLSGLQQRQSVFKAVNNMLQELDIPTAGGTTWKPNMPTRKTMAKYDELTKAVVALLEVKKGKDKLEAEIELIKSQRELQ